MAKVTITKDNMLSSDAFKTWLEESEASDTTLDNVLDLLRQLVTFEKKFDVRSDIFYARFMRGEMGDDMAFIKWAGRYELYLEAKQALDQQLITLTKTA